MSLRTYRLEAGGWRLAHRAAATAVPIAAALIAAGCAATSDPATGDLRLDLLHRDPQVRMEAAVHAAGSDRADLVPDLVDRLEDYDASVRFVAGIALKKMTGHDFGYRSFGGALERAEAIGRWRTWVLASHGAAAGRWESPARGTPPAKEGAGAPPRAEGAPREEECEGVPGGTGSSR